MIIRGFLLFLLFLVPFSGFAAWWTSHGVSLLADGVSVEAIREVELGMTREEVIAVLGPPLSEGPPPFDPAMTTLKYSRPAYFALWYPMLWVHMEGGKVLSVYAKRYIDWGVDDVGVYGLYGTAPERFETELFEETFPR